MKKIIGFILAFAVAIAMVIDGYIVFFRGNRQNATNVTQKSTTTSSSHQSTSQTNSDTKTQKQYKNGTFVGKAVQTNRGTVQVSATISDGKLKDVKVIKYPNDNPKSKEINAQALPVYKSEAIKAQSAKIDHVSGATETYNGFTGSLQNALNQAM